MNANLSEWHSLSWSLSLKIGDRSLWGAYRMKKWQAHNTTIFLQDSLVFCLEIWDNVGVLSEKASGWLSYS